VEKSFFNTNASALECRRVALHSKHLSASFLVVASQKQEKRNYPKTVMIRKTQNQESKQLPAKCRTQSPFNVALPLLCWLTFLQFCMPISKKSLVNTRFKSPDHTSRSPVVSWRTDVWQRINQRRSYCISAAADHSTTVGFVLSPLRFL